MEIVATPDEICKQCKIGKHCRHFIEKDLNNMRIFTRIAEREGRADKVTVGRENLPVNNGNDLFLPKLITTAGTVHKVLLHTLFSFGE